MIARRRPIRIKRTIRGMCALAFVVALGIFLSRTVPFARQAPPSQRTESAGRPMSRPPISYRPATADQVAAKLSIPPEDTAEARSAMKFLNTWMNDPVFKTFFYYTHDFFGNKPEAFPAARFVSLTLLFDESPENFYLMKWTQRDLKQYSNEILSTLEAKRGEIDANPYFHNRMLNLVNQLDVAPERRLAFWGDTIQRPIVLLKSGELDDSSHSFEIALLLAQQDDPSGNSIAPYVQKLLDSNPGPAELAAIRERVETFYPRLTWLFRTSSAPEPRPDI